MSNESTRVHFAQRTQIVPMRFRRLTAARKATASVFFCLLTLFAAACDDDGSNDGSNGGNKSAVAKIETRPVDLPPGQTEALMAWEPSVGPVTNYMVFASRNGSTFEFESTTLEPSATIAGRAGDELRIVVMAISENGTPSNTSPPSAPVRFHAEKAEQNQPTSVAAATSLFDRAASAIASLTEGGSDSASNDGDATSAAPADTQSNETQIAAQVAPSTLTLPPVGAEALQVAKAEQALSAPERVDDAETEAGDRGEDAETSRRTALLERLLSADARLAPRGRSNAADAWIQSFVDEDLAAGVAFVGTGNANDDAMRELVWQDSSGQLFVSDGESFLNSDDPADTLKEALRLQANERFVAFDELGGDAGSEWLIEDTLTDQVFIVHADAESTRDATPLNQRGDDLQLIGLGDFDGDDQGDLLWRIGGGAALALGTEDSGWMPAAGSEIAVQEDRRTDLPLAIADLNGDGNDDLLSRDWDGRLRITLFVVSEALPEQGTTNSSKTSKTFKAFWAGGAHASTLGLELVGTLDLDHDGEAEIAWVDATHTKEATEATEATDDDALQIWDANEGRESLPEF